MKSFLEYAHIFLFILDLFTSPCPLVITIFSIFNLILVVDAFGAAAKWLPREFPKSEKEKGETAALVRRTSAAAIVTPNYQLFQMLETKRKVKAGVNVAIAVNRLSSHASSLSNSKKD
jgi:hypothetical protein